MFGAAFRPGSCVVLGHDACECRFDFEP